MRCLGPPLQLLAMGAQNFAGSGLWLKTHLIIIKCTYEWHRLIIHLKWLLYEGHNFTALHTVHEDTLAMAKEILTVLTEFFVHLSWMLPLFCYWWLQGNPPKHPTNSEIMCIFHFLCTCIVFLVLYRNIIDTEASLSLSLCKAFAPIIASKCQMYKSCLKESLKRDKQ